MGESVSAGKTPGIAEGPPQGSDRRSFAAHATWWTDLLSGALLLLITVLLLMLGFGDINATGLELAVTRILALITVPFAAWGGARWLIRVRDRRPRLSFTHQSIVDRTWLGTEVEVLWQDVERLEITSWGALELKVRSPGALGVPALRRLVSWIIRRSRDADLVIPINGLLPDKDTIAAEALSRQDDRLFGELRRDGRLGVDARLGEGGGEPEQ
jgi:hypothetical protein